jgi:hypothetical protein
MAMWEATMRKIGFGREIDANDYDLYKVNGIFNSYHMVAESRDIW